MAFDIGAAIKAIAPTIATGLGTFAGGPAGGAVANLAYHAIADALLGDEKPTDMKAIVAKVGDVLAGGINPEQARALHEADQAFAVRMREMDVDVLKIDAGDRDSARNRETALGGDWTVRVLGGIVGGFFITVFYVLTGRALVDSALAGTLIGYVSAKAEQVVSYYFGSSAGSKAKTDIMSDVSKRAAQS